MNRKKMTAPAGMLLAVAFLFGCLNQRPYQAANPAAPPPYVKPSVTSAPSSAIQQASGRYVAPQQARVDAVASRILMHNKQLGLHARFEVIPGADRKMLHKSDRLVQLTEGMVDACVRDEQLAALLALELGRMAAQRQADRASDDERLPPLDVRIGGPDGGGFGPQLQQAEMAKLGMDRRKPASESPPNAEDIARQILMRSGFAPAELDGIRNLAAP